MASRVTTKNGDTGTTRTLSGEVLSKGNIVLECTGRVDAARAQVALLRAMVQERKPADHEAVADFLFWLLHTFFLIGTEVNDPECRHPEYRSKQLSPAHLTKLEGEQARLEAALTLPRSFIACAANAEAAQADVAATAVRDLERELVRLQASVPAFQGTEPITFINRVSDYLYILARYLEGGRHQPVDYSLLD